MHLHRGRRTVHLLVVCAVAAACATHKADVSAPGSIETVHVTTNIAAVRDCRIIRYVDSRDTALGCGPSVPATPEECLRYQVRSVGGDTLLMRGPAGEAYDCGRAELPAVAGKEPTSAARAKTPAQAVQTPAPASAATPTPGPVAAAAVSVAAAAATAPAAVPEAPSSVRATTDRSSAVGCMYLGEVDWTPACVESAGTVFGPCAEKARKLAGNLVVRAGAQAEVFWCRPTP